MSSLDFSQAIVSRSPLSPVEARRQHEALIRLLHELGVNVVEVDGAGPHLEDSIVVCNGTALITKPQSQSSQAKLIRPVLKDQFDLPITEVLGENTKLEGGDVLFTGKEFFIGLSQWTNEAGARSVAEAFPEYPCTPIKVPEKKLKNFVSVAGPDLLCVGASEQAQQVLRRMEREATYSYHTITVPEDEAANCLYVNGTLIHRAIEEIPESFKVFCEKVDFARRSICFSELSKDSTGLTSCCLLFTTPKYVKSL